MIQQSEYVSAVERESSALADAAEGHLDALVVSCPGWDVADLVWHVREVQWVWAQVVGGLLEQPPDERQAPARPGDPKALLADFRDGLAELCRTLGESDPAARCWTWAPQQDAAFVIRHQAQEAAVHRWDAELAAGLEPALIDTAIAADAVEEFITYSSGIVVETSALLPGPVRLEATDADGGWTVRETDDRRLQLVGIGHGPPGDAHSTDPVTTVRGTASDLLLGLYRRVGDDRFTVEGDARGWPALVARHDLD